MVEPGQAQRRESGVTADCKHQSASNTHRHQVEYTARRVWRGTCTAANDFFFSPCDLVQNKYNIKYNSNKNFEVPYRQLQDQRVGLAAGADDQIDEHPGHIRGCDLRARGRVISTVTAQHTPSQHSHSPAHTITAQPQPSTHNRSTFTAQHTQSQHSHSPAHTIAAQSQPSTHHHSTATAQHTQSQHTVTAHCHIIRRHISCGCTLREPESSLAPISHRTHCHSTPLPARAGEGQSRSRRAASPRSVCRRRPGSRARGTV